LHLNENLAWSGGVETYLLTLLPDLARRGHVQALAYARGDSSLFPNSYQLSELSFGTRSAEDHAAREMQRILDDFKPDLVHVHSVYNLGAVRACLARVPVVLHGHDYRYLCPASTFHFKRFRTECGRKAGVGCFPTTLRKRCMTPRPRYALDYYRRVRWIAKNCIQFAGVVAPSEAARLRFLAAGFAPKQVKTLPYFCPLEPAAKPRPIPKKPTVLFIGRIRPNKGVDVFLQAIAQLPSDVQTLMVGDFTPDLRRATENKAMALGCADRIELQGWVDRKSVRGVFELATVFAFPSVWPETLGIVGIEALACGVPVVASDIGGVREWLRPGETGRLVPPGDAVALATGLQELLFDTALNRAMGTKGISLVRERFSPNYHQEHLLQFYEDSMARLGVVRRAL
jgi:glycosyltransferase involved in cell wall biosynthesis